MNSHIECQKARIDVIPPRSIKLSQLLPGTRDDKKIYR